ncbi:MAG: TOBE-like domain-containing protein [Xanthomonadales bacterium]|nr:TOBE-like domain-containing protein [Xanthomonadales bacterium]ODU91892.1 MAG: sulfate ABC transporter [Rhodanobacter sp. SCN 66-43]OJY84875.1 MAG: sulfate ABC transporter ATP-binding protein [Xanthomonadales bacterium 66-474]
MTLELSHLTRRFTDYPALDDVSLEIPPGEFLALLGPSGSGKTTLLRILAGLDYPDSGSVRQEGRDLLALDARRRKVGLVFQHYALFRHLTVADNVAFGLRVRPWRTRPKRADIAARVERLLQRVQLDGLGKRYPAQLSGGQRQRVALARALAVEPDLLLLDEPFGALDAQVRVSLRRWLRELHDDLGLTTVFVTHDQEEALELADRVAVMNRGRIEQVGAPETIYHDPATPFVCEFIGKANKIHLQRAGRAMAAAEWNFGEAPWGTEVKRALAYVRPEQLELCASSAGPGWPTQVRHIYLAGSVAHLELDAPTLGQRLEAQVASEDLARLGLRAGMDLRVGPRRAIVFPSGDSPCTAAASKARWLWQHEAGADPAARLRAIPLDRKS